MKMVVLFKIKKMKTRISTRLQQVLAIGAMGLLAGCQQEMMESEMNLKSNEEVPVVLTVRQGVDSESRIAYTPSTPENDGSIAMDVEWVGSEDEKLAYTYYDSEGVHLNYLSPVMMENRRTFQVQLSRMMEKTINGIGFSIRVRGIVGLLKMTSTRL